MNRHRVAGSRLPIRNRCLSRNCGTNLDLDGINFEGEKPNLVYMDKVFSFNEDTSSPLLLDLNTGGCHSHKYKAALTLNAPGCNLIPCTLDENAVFTIDNSFVVVEYFNTRPPGNISPSQVTLDGFNVDSVCYTNGQYVAKTASIIPKIQRDKCLNRDLPSKVFFLIENAGPWDFRAKFVLEGTVNTGGRNCRFCLVITNAENSCNISLPNSSLSTFAVPDLSIPCPINSIAPDIQFQFNANIEMINPKLIVNCGRRHHHRSEEVEGAEVEIDSNEGSHHHHHHHHHPDVIISPSTCRVSLETTLAIEPTIHVETIRKTLFCVNACEGQQPCQGSVAAALAEEEEECNLKDIIGPDCRCNNVAGTSVRNNCGSIGNCQDVASNRTCGGVTMGVGTCEDCNNGVLGERTNKNRDRVLGESFCRDILLGESTCRDRVGGENVCELLCEVLDRLGDTSCGDVAGVCGLGVDGTWGCGCCNNVRGVSDNNNRKETTAFQFNGCNGCSW